MKFSIEKNTTTNSRFERLPIFFLIGFMIFGVILIIMGILEQRNINYKKETFIPTDGVLYDYTEKTYTETDEDGNKHTETRYYAKYEYYVDDIRYEAKNGYSLSRPTIGSSETILYNPENYSDYIFESSNSIALSIVGGAFTIASIIFIIIFKAKKLF